MQGILQDKVAVITGSGRGIGRGIALMMAKEGAKIVVNDLGVEVDGKQESSKIADQVVNDISNQGGTAIANYDSVATMIGCENIIQTALDNFGQLDIVVTPAGILRDRMIFNMTEEEWDGVITTHLKGTFGICKHAAIIFRQQRSGRIITFSSTSGLIGNPGQANYGAAKDGIAGFTRVAARDLGRYGVTVNSIAPSADTRMVATISDSARQLRSKAGIGASAGTSIIKLRQDADDIAPMAVWLSSDKASNVNGNIFFVAGGVVSLLNQPEPVKEIYKNGRWSVEEIAAIFPSTLGRELINPAPPKSPTT